MDSIRVEAKTVNDAILEAAIQLGTSSDNIEYTVVSEGSRGFFGIGGKKAVIEAKKKFTDEDLIKEVFGADEQKPKKEPKREQKKEGRKEAPAEKKEFTGKKDSSEKRERKDASKENRNESRKENRREDFREKKEASAEPKRERREYRKPTFEERKAAMKEHEMGDQHASVEAQAQENVKETPAAAPAEPKTPRVPADPQEAKRRAEKFLGDMFRVMGMSVEIRTEFAEDTLTVDLSGGEMGLLIGKRGQTLDSLQYLTSLAVNKGKASYVRVKLDTEDYRNRRKATLENLAKNIAFKVKKTKRPVFLEPMNPYERRIIHSALQNDPYVTTHSEGEEPCRKVVVTPRKRNERPAGGHGEYQKRNFDRKNDGGKNFEAKAAEAQAAETKAAEGKTETETAGEQ